MSTARVLRLESEQILSAVVRIAKLRSEMAPVSMVRIVAVTHEIELAPADNVKIRVAGVSTDAIVYARIAGLATPANIIGRESAGPPPPVPEGTMALTPGALHVVKYTIPAAVPIAGVRIQIVSAPEGVQHFWACLIQDVTMTKFADTENVLTGLSDNAYLTLPFPERSDQYTLSNPVVGYIGVCCVADVQPVIAKATGIGGITDTGCTRPGSAPLGQAVDPVTAGDVIYAELVHA